MTSVISGRSLPMPFARASCAGGGSPCLRTWTDTGLLGLPMSLETLPAWGCLLGGELYELPMPALLTGVSESLSWSVLPTPTAQAAKHGETPDLTASGYGSNLWDLPTLLPTPTVMDMGSNYTPEQWEAWKQEQKANHQNGNGHGPSLYQEAVSLLPSPISREQTLGWTWQRDGVIQEDTLPRALTALLPTPVADHSRGLPQPQTDFQSLPNVAVSIGARTPPPSGDGSPSPDPHLTPLSQAPTDDPDCPPTLWNG